MKGWPKSEVELARPVVAWLRLQRWEVYQEVQMGNGGPVADIVARLGNLYWVVECKTKFGLAVMDQAHGWLGYAHLVSVAVPVLHRSGDRRRILGDQLGH